MFCPQCGTNNADNSAVCVQCGRMLQAVPPPPSPPMQGVVIPPGTVPPGMVQPGVVLPPGATVPNYLVFAILATVFCCLPTGIPAIIYAAQVNAKLQQGDLAGAQVASRNAKMWCWISFGAGLAVCAFSIMLSMLGVLASLHN